jgi:hypothetical protein
MVSGLPCEALRELIQEVLLHFHPRNVAQTMTATLATTVPNTSKTVRKAGVLLLTPINCGRKCCRIER